MTFNLSSLRPYPAHKQGSAYNSADVLLIESAHDRGLQPELTLIVNDEFGALCLALEAQTLLTDSALSSLALANNQARANSNITTVLWSTDTLITPYSTVVLRVPKQLSYFEFQLSQLAQILPAGAVVLAAGMDKHLSPTTANLLERYIGPTQRHRGRRKARLFSATRDTQQKALYAGTSQYYCDSLQCDLVSLANSFAREHIDMGSRFLLEHLDQLTPVDNAIDLGCGNGIIGLTALHKGLCQKITLCDESAMAIASARTNFSHLFPGQSADFYHGDGLLGYNGEAAELILCNPPFHQNHRMDETVGRRLLVQAAAHLRKGGRLYLVANRHLDYLPTLQREFSTVEKCAQNNKFIIWSAYR